MSPASEGRENHRGSDAERKGPVANHLGLIQMEMNVRPDGQRPFGLEACYKYHQPESRALRSRGSHYELSESGIGRDCSRRVSNIIIDT